MISFLLKMCAYRAVQRPDLGCALWVLFFQDIESKCSLLSWVLRKLGRLAEQQSFAAKQTLGGGLFALQ